MFVLEKAPPWRRHKQGCGIVEFRGRNAKTRGDGDRNDNLSLQCVEGVAVVTARLQVSPFNARWTQDLRPVLLLQFAVLR